MRRVQWVRFLGTGWESRPKIIQPETGKGAEKYSGCTATRNITTTATERGASGAKEGRDDASPFSGEHIGIHDGTHRVLRIFSVRTHRTHGTHGTHTFVKKTGERLQVPNDHEERAQGLYTRTHVLCVPCVLARQPMIASRVVGQCTREKSDHPPSVRPAASKRAVILFSVGPTSSKPNSVTGLFRPDVVARLGFGLRLRHPDWSDRRRCEW